MELGEVHARGERWVGGGYEAGFAPEVGAGEGGECYWEGDGDDGGLADEWGGVVCEVEGAEGEGGVDLHCWRVDVV